MAEETTTTVEETTTTTEAEATEEQRVPLERFQQVNKKAKEAADRAKALEQQMQELQAQIEEREQAGLPELDQLKKRLEAAEKRTQEAEQRATETEQSAGRMRAQQWITAAATAQNFEDPEDAILRIETDGIESADDAERAVKRLAKAKPRLLKAEEPTLPGRVLSGGQRVKGERTTDPAREQAEREGNMILEGINALRRQGWQSAGPM